MHKAKTFYPAAIFILLASQMVAADTVVVRDEGVSITRAEFEALMETVPSSMKSMAARDPEERLQIIDSWLRTKKMAAEFDRLPEDTPGYWKAKAQILAMKKNFIFKQARENIVVPNAEPLLREYYKTRKEKYALVPEKRASSHILLASPPGLPRDEVRARAQQLLDELRAGADFEDYVEKFSEDPGSKARGGKLSKEVRRGEEDITPPYLEALFDIEEVGGYSEITDSQFGIHIIRLDGITPAYYRDYEEVRNEIYEDVLSSYNALTVQEISARYMITEDAFIDGPAMDEIFSAAVSEGQDD